MHTFHGRDHIVEELPDGPGGSSAEVPHRAQDLHPDQPEQTVHMYRLVRHLAGLQRKELVYDLYCGAGGITLFVAAGQAARVVERGDRAQAAGDAERNAALNGVQNVAFEAGDLEGPAGS